VSTNQQERIAALVAALELDDAVVVTAIDAAGTLYRIDGETYGVLTLAERNALWREAVGRQFNATAPDWLPTDMDEETYVAEVMSGEAPEETLGELIASSERAEGFEVYLLACVAVPA
jgi:hypothetical protein